MSAVIDVQSLRKCFGSFEAVRGVSFQVQPGEIFGYLGANGAGKSTTIRMLCGLLGPTDGTAVVAGCDVSTNPEGVRLLVGYMSQKFSLYPDLTAIENLDFFGGAYRLGRKHRLARAAKLLEEVEMTSNRNTITAALPGGMRQRLALAAALLHQPRVVFLDEPTAGVDPEARRRFWRVIRRLADEGTTVFVTTHYMDEAEYCGRVGLMVDGKLVALDTPAALKRSLVPGRLLSIRGRNLDRNALQAFPGLWNMEPFGAGLHVRGDPVSLDPGLVHKALSQAGASELSVAEIEPTLEDVFLAVAGKAERCA